VTPEVAERSHDEVEIFEQEVSPGDGLAQTVLPEVHNNPIIQHVMDIWHRIRDYDKKSAETPFIPVLTRKHKQHLKKIMVGKPYNTCSMGDNSSTDQ